MVNPANWPSERTIATMRKRIGQLDQVLGEQDPPIQANFREPATKAAIEKAEKKIGMKFPKDLIAYLLAVNGQKLGRDRIYPSGDIFVPQMRFRRGRYGLSAWGQLLQLHKIVELSRMQLAEDEFEDDSRHRDFIGPVAAHQQHIIITMADDPCSIALDMQPGKGGRVGQVISVHDQPEYTACIAPSLSAYLKRMVDGFREGRFFRDDWRIWTEK